MNNNLENIGLSKIILDNFISYKKEHEDVDLYLGRVISEHRGNYKVCTNSSNLLAKVPGKIIYNSLGRDSYPAVGDWVILDRDTDSSGEAIINHILPRKSKFSRKIAGNTIDEQIVAVNIDTIFICMALNKDFNLRRLERYISVSWDSGATPVVILTKSDLCEDLDERLSAAYNTAIGIDVIVVSSMKDEGIEKVKSLITMGSTVAFLGSSGVGKSTLINKLLEQDKQVVSNISDFNDKGRHTTTHRELIPLPNGGAVIDTPGMRELQLLDNSEGIDESFSDIHELSNRCKFSDCKHLSEPGCAVRDAIETGSLTQERFNSYVKLKKEALFMERKLNKTLQADKKKEMIKINKELKKRKKGV